MKIGIFGGSFNPPHKMHMEIAKELLNKHYVDKIIFVPTGSKYEYKHNLVEDKYRLEMLNILTNKDERIIVSGYELKDYVVYTCDTLEYFKKIYNNDEIYFICGTDNLSYIDKWKKGLDILNNYKIIVIKRNSNEISGLLNKYQQYINNIIVASIPLNDMSSTNIRLLIKQNNIIELYKYLDKDIINYIYRNKLYQD